MTHDRDRAVDRRNVLRGITASGAVALGTGRVTAETSEVGEVRFVEIGLEHTVSTDGETYPISLDSPPKYRITDGGVAFFDEHLSETERRRIEAGVTLIGGADVRRTPATDVGRSPDNYAVTATRPDLAPRDGVLLAETYAQPRPAVTTAGSEVRVRTAGRSVTVADGSQRTVELPTRRVRTNRFERGGSATATDPREPAEPTGYESVTAEAELVPRLVVRNHGRVTARRVAERTGGD